MNKDKVRGYYEHDYEQNREARLAKNRRNNALEVNVIKGRERSRRRRAEDPESCREADRRWRERNPDKVSLKNLYRYNLRRVGEIVGGTSTVEYPGVLSGDPCSYCGAASGTVDHIVPVAAGGTHEWENLTSACLSCNSSKGAKPLLHWLLTR